MHGIMSGNKKSGVEMGLNQYQQVGKRRVPVDGKACQEVEEQEKPGSRDGQGQMHARKEFPCMNYSYAVWHMLENCRW